MKEVEEEVNSSEDPLPNNLAVPLVLDDGPMEENDDLQDIEEDIERVRNRNTARTLCRQPRTDADTL
jgi:hypothetical protein